MKCIMSLNEFTKEELQYFLMTMKPFHFLWKHDPLALENKLQSMIDIYDAKVIEAWHCEKCGHVQ